MSEHLEKKQSLVWVGIATLVFSLAIFAFYHSGSKQNKETSTKLPSIVLNGEPSLFSQILQSYPLVAIFDNNGVFLLNEKNNFETTVIEEKAFISEDDIDGTADTEFAQIEDISELIAKLPNDAQDAIDDIFDAVSQAKKITEQFTYTIQSGDTLSKILDESGLDDNVGHQLVKQYPDFHQRLRPGQKIYWTLNNEGKLMYLNWIISYREERVYTRTPENTFNLEVIKQETEWRDTILEGVVENSLYHSFKKLGVNNSVVAQATNALQWQINMRQLRNGDKFIIKFAQEFLKGEPTGRGDVKAVRLRSGGVNFYAIQAANGSFYNDVAETTGKGFSRYPFSGKYRVSSPFSLHRRHPITGRVRPHKGVDWAMPIGTKVFAPADGVVEKVAFQPDGAGRYIVIRHSLKYQTIYMHLHRTHVIAGDKVKRGQVIAQSGNSGRSTGPHLHYEVRVDGNPWNPVTVNLPHISEEMTTKEKKAFLELAKKVKQELQFKE